MMDVDNDDMHDEVYVLVPTQAPAPAAAMCASSGGDGRDPAIVQFEQSLTNGLQDLMKNNKKGRQQDYVTTDEYGVYLYNANLCAIIIEGCDDNTSRENTKKRVKIGLDKIAKEDGGWPDAFEPKYLQLEGFKNGESCLVCFPYTRKKTGWWSNFGRYSKLYPRFRWV